MNTWKQWITASLFILSLSGCATLREETTAPNVTITDIRMLDTQLLEQRYRLTLRVQNPNRFDLDINGMSFDLEINGQSFAHGVNNHPAHLPAFGEALLDVQVSSGLLNIIDQLTALEQRPGGGLSYRLSGKISTEGALFSLPFEHTGVIGARLR